MLGAAQHKRESESNPSPSSKPVLAGFKRGAAVRIPRLDSSLRA